MGRFVEFLTYKAEKIGKRLIRIDESYTSSVFREALIKVLSLIDTCPSEDAYVDNHVSFSNPFLELEFFSRFVDG